MSGVGAARPARGGFSCIVASSKNNGTVFRAAPLVSRLHGPPLTPLLPASPRRDR